MRTKDKQKLLAKQCEKLFQLDEETLKKYIPHKITIDEIFSDCHTDSARRLRIKRLAAIADKRKYPDIHNTLSSFCRPHLSRLIDDHLQEVTDAPDLALMKQLLGLIQEPCTKAFLWRFLETPYRALLFEDDFTLLKEAGDEALFLFGEAGESFEKKESLFYRLRDDELAKPYLEERLSSLTSAALRQSCYQDDKTLLTIETVLLENEAWHPFITRAIFYEKMDWGRLCGDSYRGLFFKNDNALLKAIALESLLCPNERDGEHAGASLFCLLMDDGRARPFLEEKIEGLTAEQLKIVCRDTKIGKQSVQGVLLSDSNWHDYLLTKEIYQKMNWEEAIDKDIESVLQLAHTQQGREILLKDNAKILKRIPQKEIHISFILALFEDLDNCAALQAVLKEKHSNLYLSLFDNFQARDNIKLNTMVGSSVAAPIGTFATKLNSPALMLARTAFGQQLFLQNDDLFDALSDEAMVSTNENGVSVLSCFLEQRVLSDKVLERSSVFRAVDELRLYDARPQTKVPKRLVDVILAHPNYMTILLKEDAHCLSLLKKNAQDFLFATMSETELISQLADGMSTLTSFNNIQTFLFASCRMDWFKAPVFQKAIAMLFMNLIDKGEITPDSFRQFTQYMEKEAYNQLNALGGSVVYYLSEYKEGIALIKDKGLVSMLDDATLDATINTDNAETSKLRDILRDECSIMFQTAEGSHATFFKMSH